MAGADRSAAGRLTARAVTAVALLWAAAFLVAPGAGLTGDADLSGWTVTVEPSAERAVPVPARAPASSPGAPSVAVDPTAAFAVRVDRIDVPLRILAVPVVPGQTVRISGLPGSPADLQARAGAGTLRRVGASQWTWTAPARGFHAVRVVSREARDSVSLTFLVARPASEVRDGRLLGYPIGSYRPRPASMSRAYEPPSGFVEVRPEQHDVLVSPNFTLGQFLCKQPGDPRFVLVSGPLLVKLEALLSAVNEAGHAVPTLAVMSGFRTPAYNRAIGNTTDFSRHLWGDAADVFVDADGDGNMDDVTGDGRVNTADARWLASLVEGLMDHGDDALVPGGLAVYRANDLHGPFVHVDARGHRSRW